MERITIQYVDSNVNLYEIPCDSNKLTETINFLIKRPKTTAITIYIRSKTVEALRVSKCPIT